MTLSDADRVTERSDQYQPRHAQQLVLGNAANCAFRPWQRPFDSDPAYIGHHRPESVDPRQYVEVEYLQYKAILATYARLVRDNGCAFCHGEPIGSLAAAEGRLREAAGQ